MKTPFNITLPAELPPYRKIPLLTWRIAQRLLAFVILPIVAFFTAISYAVDEDSIRDFPENFWRCFSRTIRYCWYVTAGYYTAGYYNLYRPTGGCGPWTWFKERPEDPQDGSGDYYRWSNGYAYGGRF